MWMVIVKVHDSYFVPFIPRHGRDQAVFGSFDAALKCAQRLEKNPRRRYREILITHASVVAERPCSGVGTKKGKA